MEAKMQPSKHASKRLSICSISLSEEFDSSKIEEDTIPEIPRMMADGEQCSWGSISSIDKLLRYSLISLGLLSGEATLVKSKTIRNLTTIYHAIISIMLIVNQVIVFIVAWDAEEDKVLYSLFLKIAVIIWSMLNASCTCIMFINCHRKTGLIAIHKQLRTVEQSLLSLGVKVRHHRIRKGIILIAVISWMFALSNFAVKLLDLLTVQQQDAIYGPSLQNRLDSYAIFWGLHVYGNICTFILYQNWIFIISYLLAIAFTLTTVFADFNRKLLNDIESSPRVVLERLEQYRVLHLQLCELVGKANSSFSLIIGGEIGLTTVIMLIILYLLSIAISDPSASGLMVTFIYWISCSCIILCSIIGFAHSIHAETTESQNHLMGVFEADIDISTKHVYQMQLFLNRASKPESLTTGGLLDVNKDLGITIFSVVVSYYLVMAQFNSSPVAESGSLCNCTSGSGDW